MSILGDKKIILITGGAGFIGNCLVRKLLKESNFTIFNLDKLGYASDHKSIDYFLNQNKDLSQRYNFLKVDLINKNETQNAIQKSNPDLIVHLAAESHVDRSIENPFNFIESNIIGTFNLLDAALNHYDNLEKSRKNFFKFVHISTDEVFGSLDEKGKFSEDTPYDPRSPYSASKASSDHFVKAWFHTYGLPTLITNCSNNYGPYQFPEKLIPVTILKALNNEEIPLYGDGKNIRDWLYVEDHINGIIKVIEKGEIGKNYCIGGFGEKSNIEVVKIICKKLNKIMECKTPFSNLIKLVDDRPGHDKRYSINSKLITKELGWIPIYSFEKGLEKTIKWYLNNLSWCKEIMQRSNFKGQRIGIKNKN